MDETRTNDPWSADSHFLLPISDTMMHDSGVYDETEEIYLIGRKPTGFLFALGCSVPSFVHVHFSLPSSESVWRLVEFKKNKKTFNKIITIVITVCFLYLSFSNFFLFSPSLSAKKL